MNRKQFIQSHGATCRNWNWSWSFVNEARRIVIFGEWDIHRNNIGSKILDEAWEFSHTGRRKPGYPEAYEHIRLVETAGYQLQTFPMIHSEADEGNDGGTARIAGFLPRLTRKHVKRIGSIWYATDLPNT